MVGNTGRQILVFSYILLRDQKARKNNDRKTIDFKKIGPISLERNLREFQAKPLK